MLTKLNSLAAGACLISMYHNFQFGYVKVALLMCALFIINIVLAFTEE